MHLLAPIPILLGVAGVVVGLLWLVAAGSVDEADREFRMFPVFNLWDVAFHVCQKLFNDPMSILPAFRILAVSVGLIGVGTWML